MLLSMVMSCVLGEGCRLLGAALVVGPAPAPEPALVRPAPLWARGSPGPLPARGRPGPLPARASCWPLLPARASPGGSGPDFCLLGDRSRASGSELRALCPARPCGPAC